MSTDAIFYGDDVTLTLGVNGNVPRATDELETDGCCADPLCLDFCNVACAFTELLPIGPMWDCTRDAALSHFTTGGTYDPGNPYQCPLPELTCPSMALYAIYGARVLTDMVSSILAPAIQEAYPATANNTLDDWLERYDWNDCYASICRSVALDGLSPYENDEDACDNGYCAPEYNVEFERALKHNILQALVRAQKGVIKNLDGLNWIIAPLGAQLRPVAPFPDYIIAHQEGNCDTDELATPPCGCDDLQLEICPNAERLAGCPTTGAICGTAVGTVPALQVYDCGGTRDAQNLYPGVLAAECILRSLLNRRCPSILNRCGELATDATTAP